MKSWVLNLLHRIGLTNLTDEEVNRYSLSANKGQYWKRESCGHVWIRFIFEISCGKIHFLEYIPEGIVPYRGTDNDYHNHDNSWILIGPEEAKKLITNMEAQDAEYSFRLGKKNECENLAQALKILEGVKVYSVDMYDNVVRISASNGAEYEIAISCEGYTSRQTCLPD